MGKAAKSAPAEAVEFPSNIYGINPKALSELSEVCTYTKTFNSKKKCQFCDIQLHLVSYLQQKSSDSALSTHKNIILDR